MVLMIALVQQGKKISINFSKAKAKFCLSLQCNGDESHLYVNKTFKKHLKIFYKS